MLRFQPELLQWHAAAEPLKRDGLLKFIAKPEFSPAGQRLPRKWDALALLILGGLEDDARSRALQRIAEIDPFLAALDLQRGAATSPPLQETLVERLVNIGADNRLARAACRDALAMIPQPRRHRRFADCAACPARQRNAAMALAGSPRPALGLAAGIHRPRLGT